MNIKIRKSSLFNWIVLAGCLFFSWQVMAMGMEPKKLELKIEKKIPITNPSSTLFVFYDENENEYLISDENKMVTFRKNNQISKVIEGYHLVRRTPDSVYYLLQTNIPTPERNSMEAIFQDHLTVCDFSGKEIWNANGVGSYGYFFSPNGEYAVAFTPAMVNPARPPSFINKNGFINSDVVSFKISNLDRWSLEYSKITKKNFSKSGKLLAFALLKGSEGNAIFIFDDKGHPVVSYDAPLQNINDMIISDDDKKITISGLDNEGIKSIIVIDIYTNKILWKNTDSIQHLVCTWNSNTEIITPSQNASGIQLINLEGRRKWTLDLDPCLAFRPNSIQKVTNFLIVNGYCQNPDYPVLLIINNEGNILSTLKLDPETIRSPIQQNITLLNKKKLIINEKKESSVFSLIEQ